jgi:hypothetical protein
MAKQQAVKDDEKKFLQTSRESAEQLLHLFETDAAQARAGARAGANLSEDSAIPWCRSSRSR